MQAINRLSKAAIEEFKAVYLAEFQEVLTDEQAEEIGIRLLKFVKVLLEEFTLR